MLEIVYENDHIIAINKPHGLLVHQSPIARDANEFALQLLKEQVGHKVYPAHRLDRKTAGILLFAKNANYAKQLHLLFQENKLEKTYLAIVRGYTDLEGVINYALTNEAGKNQEAITRYKTLDKFEIDLPFGKHLTSRYSLVELYPETGRYHQLRKHMAHIFHPILADRPHGCNKQNKLWKETFKMDTMMLHASKLSFEINNKKIEINAEISNEFNRVLDILRNNRI
jgi:tRNA pseudouridine65 synthase